MRDDAEHEDKPKVINANFPEWAKFAATIVGTTILTVGWAEARFVSRVEWITHTEQQRVDLARLAVIQEKYAVEEKGTSRTLGEINARLTRIETILEPYKRSK